MRKSKTSIPALIIAFLCIAVYAVALVVGAYRFYVNAAGRRAIAEREFYDLADLASAAGVLGFMDAPFQEAIQDGLEKSGTLEGVIISGPSGEYAFERERGAIIRWEGDSPRFANRFGVSSTSAVPLRVNGLRNVNISAGFNSIDYDYTITILKHSLIVILAALAAAFLTFLVESALARDQIPVDGRRENRRRREYDEEEVRRGFDEDEPAGRRAGNPENQAGSHEAPASSGFSDDTEASAGDFYISEEDFSSGAFSQEDAASKEDEAPAGEKSGDLPPQGLYAPSGIGWEAYTKDRLESELHRCASFEQDLTLMIVAFSGKDRLTGEQYKQLTGMAVSFFNLRDLIFEMGDRGITVILPNTDVEQGFARAEDFHNYLIPAFTGIPDFRIGLSSRSGRLVDAGRLYFEAEEALNKALRDPVSPVIAFKSDPEKYRAFLRSRGK
ncbi:MAG: hypothetical protein LBB98_10900 [Treponema sp.]|jgi:hypothetical protein|nr:hypothetical protein [Treponema sp.]